MTQKVYPASPETADQNARKFVRGLGLFDSTMLVVGAMIGSGIFIVPAEMTRHVGSAGWLLVAWGVAGALTIAGALCYGELAAMMPQAGGMYIYLREAYSPLWGFLYGWTLFAVIETGTLAAVAVAFARFAGVLFPLISEDKYLVPPIHISAFYALSLSTAQLLAIGVILLLAFSNTLPAHLRHRSAPYKVTTGIPYPEFGVYPTVRQTPYPQPGTANSSVRVGVCLPQEGKRDG